MHLCSVPYHHLLYKKDTLLLLHVPSWFVLKGGHHHTIPEATPQSSLIARTFSSSTPVDLSTYQVALINTYARPILVAVLAGFAGVAPRSSTSNLIELLSTLVGKAHNECRAWISEILFSVRLFRDPAHQADKILRRTNSLDQKRIRKQRKSSPRLF
jgi:hypothetical protein